MCVCVQVRLVSNIVLVGGLNEQNADDEVHLSLLPLLLVPLLPTCRAQEAWSIGWSHSWSGVA